MNSKEKRKDRRITLILWGVIILSVILIACYTILSKPKAYASEKTNEIKISNAQEINLENIINKNTNVTTKEEIVKEDVELEYITKYKDNNEMLKGTTKVTQEGRNGTQQIILKRTYNENGELTNEEQLSATVVKSSIDKVVEVGTAEKKIIEQKTANKASAAGLSFDMKLNAPSGFTEDQFKKALTDSNDKNKIFENNAEYFYLLENQYNINGMFVAAVGIHESGWGTSKLATSKYNLFGYGAYDSNPYNGAYKFTNYSECIDLIARVFVKYYINPAGTKIYDGTVASGKYYTGGTLSAINQKYASDKNWASSVYKYMQYLYGKV